MVKKYKETKQKIIKSKKVSIICHINPDGDAIGSSLAFYNLFENFDNEVKVIVPNDFPLFLKWMPGANDIIVASKAFQYACDYILSSDLILMVDFNSAKRTGELSDIIEGSKAYKLLFDHHLQPEDFVDEIYSDISVSSTCELVFNFISNAFGAKYLNENIAMCLYSGILTDTGNFSFSLKSETFYVVSQLLSLGVDPVKINQNIYDNYSVSRLKILGHCLANNLKYFSAYGAAYIFIKNQELVDFNYQDGDTEGIVNYPLSLKDVNLSAIFIEKDDKIKISIRSKGNFDVNLLAREYFNGGGHKNAAGGHCLASLEDAIKLFEEIIVQNNVKIKNSLK